MAYLETINLFSFSNIPFVIFFTRCVILRYRFFNIEPFLNFQIITFHKCMLSNIILYQPYQTTYCLKTLR